MDRQILEQLAKAEEEDAKKKEAENAKARVTAAWMKQV